MDRKTYESLLAKIEREYRENLAALERIWRLDGEPAQTPEIAPEAVTQVWSMIHGDEAPESDAGDSDEPAPPPAQRDESVASPLTLGPPKKGEVTAAVAAAVDDLIDEYEYFTWREVAKWVEKRYSPTFANRTTIAQVLEKMATNGTIDRVQRGAGKRATRYALPHTNGVLALTNERSGRHYQWRSLREWE